MKQDKMAPQQALMAGMQLPFALIRTWDHVYLGPTPAQAPAPDTLIEAHFFDREREVRLFRQEDELCAVSLTCEPEDQILEERYQLEKRFGSALTYSRHLGVDEDGQTIFVATQLSNWEGV